MLPMGLQSNCLQVSSIQKLHLITQQEGGKYPYFCNVTQLIVLTYDVASGSEITPCN